MTNDALPFTSLGARSKFCAGKFNPAPALPPMTESTSIDTTPTDKHKNQSYMALQPAKKKAKQSGDKKSRLLSIWDLVADELRDKVSRGDVATIEFLSTAFPSAKYPAKGSDSTHCVFCHKTFDARLPGRCSMDHEWEDGGRYQKWPPRNYFNCQRCEASEDVEEDCIPSGCCWEGVCSSDIYERMSENFHGSCGDEDDFEDCSVCLKLKERAEKEDKKTRRRTKRTRTLEKRMRIPLLPKSLSSMTDRYSIHV